MRLRDAMSAMVLLCVAACAKEKTIASLESVPVVAFDSLFRRVDSVMLVTPPDEAIGAASGIVVLPGSIILSDVTRENLKIFSSQGRLLKTIGRAGDGPGEFGYPIGMIQDGSGRVVVLDLKRGVLSTWDTSGTLLKEKVVSGGWDDLAALPGTDHVLLIGARVRKGHEAGANGEQMALHETDSTGTIIASYHSFMPPSGHLESIFAHYFAAALGNNLVTGAFTSNRVYFINRQTGAETSALVGGPWFRPAEWSRQPAGPNVGQAIALWAKQQILMLHLFPIDSSRYLAQFRSYTKDGDEQYQYVLANIGGISLVSTLPTRLRILLVHGETAYGTAINANGDVALETVKLTLPAQH